jgi:hypothetical protein
MPGRTSPRHRHPCLGIASDLPPRNEINDSRSSTRLRRCPPGEPQNRAPGSDSAESGAHTVACKRARVLMQIASAVPGLAARTVLPKASECRRQDRATRRRREDKSDRAGGGSWTPEIGRTRSSVAVPIPGDTGARFVAVAMARGFGWQTRLRSSRRSRRATGSVAQRNPRRPVRTLESASSRPAVELTQSRPAWSLERRYGHAGRRRSTQVPPDRNQPEIPVRRRLPAIASRIQLAVGLTAGRAGSNVMPDGAFRFRLPSVDWFGGKETKMLTLRLGDVGAI